MPTLLVVDHPREWPLRVSGVEVVSARAYLAEARYATLNATRVFNFCKSYRYQSIGYYVSLLAEARQHKPFPNIATIQDMKSPTLAHLMSDELRDLIQESLREIRSRRFTLSIYFGRNVARKYDRLSARLFSQFQAPFVRAQFARNSHWELQSVGPISAREIPDQHRPFVIEAANQYFEGRRPACPRRRTERYAMAILYEPANGELASDPAAIKRFVRAAGRLGIRAELIGKEDFPRIAEFDALFIRETTRVNHHTYRFARRAQAEGLVVVDDPESILKCTNKVYLAELLAQRGVRTPKTLIVHRDNVAEIVPRLGLPCILKQPDSSFSQGVVKAEDERAVRREASLLLESSDLVIAQEFLPTAFDWRIGVLDRRPLYACKYFMAPNHWQVRQHTGEAERWGRVQTLAVSRAPRGVVRLALRAANLLGRGLYGVDIKQVGATGYVIEVNDNPTIEAGVEDGGRKEGLYDRVMRVFLERLERRRQGLSA